MKKLLSDKRLYFSAFGSIGGLLSAYMYEISELEGAMESWVVGTGLDGLFIGALLAFGQGRYVGKTFDLKALTRAILIGGVGGGVGGWVALTAGFPIVDLFGGSSDAGRFIGWTFGGVAVGIAIAQVVPNLRPKIACVAGGAGGFVGCGFMYLIDDLSAGTATTGAAIGLAIAYTETVFRQAWLEVTIRPNGLSLEKERTITVTLGDQPVLFGCASDADVKLAEMNGAKAHFAKISLSSGTVTLLDLATEQSRTLSIDEGLDISNAHIIFRRK